MLKGVNREIIEIKDTENIYYERALLFLRPEYSSAKRDVLEKEARKILVKMNAPSYVKKSKRLFSKSMRIVAWVFMSTAVAVALIALCLRCV